MRLRLLRVNALAPRLLLAAYVLSACVLVACDPPPGEPPGTSSPTPAGPTAPTAPAAPAAPAVAPRSEFDLGWFTLADDPVIDADTIRLAEPRESVRIHAVDAEETFHGDKGKGWSAAQQRAEAEKDFAAYCRAERGKSPTPRKFGTPEGEAARAWTKGLFDGVRRVRLEVDEAGRDRDGYGRRLAHLFLERDGKEILFAEELIRAGHSPYFVKYGRSERYDARLRAAQAEAREGMRGIWGSAVPHYPDYDERLAWWEARAKQVDTWTTETRGKPAMEDHIRLGVATETARLPSMLGRRVTVFGSLDREEPAPPHRLLLVDVAKAPFTVVVFDDAVWKALDHGAIHSRFVRVSGTLSEFRGRVQLTLASADDLSTK